MKGARVPYRQADCYAERMAESTLIFDAGCTACPRLAQFLTDGRREYPDYYCLPVPPFGDPQARLLVVGLAPGFHGANASGRPFTGDYAGILLYDTLYRYGFATAPTSLSRDDGLQLLNARISNSVKCVPPGNKPTPDEIKRCSRFINAELQTLQPGSLLVALGTIAHTAVLRGFGLRLTDYKFAHGAEHALPNGYLLIDSYHCSRYNTNTRRLTPEMFYQVFARAKEILSTRTPTLDNRSRHCSTSCIPAVVSLQGEGAD